MEHWNWRRRLAYGTLQAVGLGFLAAAFEIAAITADLRLPMTSLDVVVLGLVHLLAMGLGAALLAGLTGLVHPALAHHPTSTAVGAQLGLTSALLSLLHLGRFAATLLAEGQPVGAAAALSMPVGLGGMIYVNARWWLRRAEVGRGSVSRWLPFAAGASLATILVLAGVHAQRSTGGERALADDENAVLVTVDGLRPDAVPPALQRLAEEGAAFVDAVTPTPHSGPSNATVLTGVHPLRHGALIDGDRLPRAHRTVAEVLAEEGYATGGFVSSAVVGEEAGMSQGFRVFDDDPSALVGLRRLAWARLLTAEAERPPVRTVDRFLGWLQRHHERAFFAWIHLKADEAQLDEALRAIREGLEANGVLDETLLVVAGTHGTMRGEHGLHGDVGLYDPAVRVPMVLRAPGVEVRVPRVEAQVRTLDLSATILDWLGFDALGASEGLSLLPYLTGDRRATVWCSLVGLDDQGRLHLGMRNNGVKYVRGADGTERLFDLRSDPDEERSVIDSQQAALEAARRLMASEVAALETLQRARGGRP